MAKIFTILNNKGGTGKTTTAINLAAALAKKNYSVLLIDLDSQCNLSVAFGCGNNNNHIGTLLMNQSSYDATVVNINKLFIIPSTDKLLDFEYLINNEPGREYLLKEILEKVHFDYDYILIDCPPSLGTLSINALVAANYYLVPMQTENFAFIGLDKILVIAEKVKKRMNPNLELAGILLIKYDQRTKFSQAVISNIQKKEALKNKLFSTYIRQDISLMESAAFHQSVFEYAPKSRGAEDYTTFANEILKKYGKK